MTRGRNAVAPAVGQPAINLTRGSEACRLATPRRSGWGPRVVACASGLLLLLLSSQAIRAQNVTEAALKAIFIQTFAKYVEWPPDALPPKVPFLACVLGDRNVADALRRRVKDSQLLNHPVTVSFATADTALRSCHLLYISAVTQAQANTVLAAVRGAPVLTMVDIESFNSRGTIVRVFVGEGGTIGFDIDLWLAKQSRLDVRSQVLASERASKVYLEPDSLGIIP